jgi:NADH dehydrogenase (ubiquinone) Fe-S protein 3
VHSPIQSAGCIRPHPDEVCPTTHSMLLAHSICIVASTSPFPEPTSPNPTLTKYAEATEKLHGYGSYIMQCLPKFVQQFSVLKDELTLYIAPSAVIPVLTFLRDHSQCQFKSLMDISGVDFPERDKRFEVVYHLLSIQYAARIRVKTYVSETDAVPSATSLFSGANWYYTIVTSLVWC